MRFLLAYLSKQDLYKFFPIPRKGLQVVGLEKTAHEAFFVLSDNSLYPSWRNPRFWYLLPVNPIANCIVRVIFVLRRLTLNWVGILSREGDE